VHTRTGKQQQGSGAKAIKQIYANDKFRERKCLFSFHQPDLTALFVGVVVIVIVAIGHGKWQCCKRR